LWGAYNIYCKNSNDFSLDNVDDDSFLDDECFIRNFKREYFKKYQFIDEITTKKENLEDYKNTLVKLYENGSLNKYGIHKIVSEIEDEEIEQVIQDKYYYFIVINKIHTNTDFKKRIKAEIRNSGDKVYDGSLFLGEGRFSLLVAVTKNDYNTKKFYDKFVKNIFTNIDKRGIVSVHKCMFFGEKIQKKKKFKPPLHPYFRKAISARDIFNTGSKTVKISFKERLIETYLSMDELLTVLPLNIFLPKLKSEKKEILIENNQEIKEEFNINKLTDWSNPNHTKEEIAEFLVSNYFLDDSLDKWKENVEKIINEAKEVSKALNKTA